MKVKKFTRIAVALLALMTAMLLAACGGEEVETVAMTELANWQAYAIVRPDVADSSTVDAAVKLNKTFEEKLGTKLTLTTDWVKRGEEVPNGTLEILVGSTNRPESAVELAYLDYTVKFENERVVINGGSGEATAAAMDWFIETCITETVMLPAETYVHHAEYPMADLTVGGETLSSYFAKSENTANDALAKSLNEWIATGTGVYPDNKSAHKIVIGENEELDILEYSMTVEAGNILLESSVGGIGIPAVVEQFKSTVEAASGGELTLPGVSAAELEHVSIATEAQMKEWRKTTDERIKEILSSPNMEIPAGKTVYYVSNKGSDANDGKTPETAWATLDKVNAAATASGSYVCFERGGLWRGQLKTKPGVTYTAYGNGDKPKLYASPKDIADPALWQKTDAENIWVYQADKLDIGTLVFNHGESHAIKCVIRTETGGQTFNNTTGEPFKTYADLTTDLHFWHDYSKSGKVYLYSEKGNPGERFDSIEVSIKQHVISVGSNANVTIDNLCIKYGGAHGVSAGTVSNLTVQNCEFGWIGGSIQSEGIFGRNYGTRYGNAVEIYGACTNFNVTDNYIYQVYDAGITQQSKVSEDVSIPTDKLVMMKNMNYSRNVLEYCNYSIEYFLSRLPADNPSRMEGFLIEDNISWYAGEGLCEQRPDPSGAHIRSSGGSNRAVDFVIRNNLWIGNNIRFYYISSDRYNPDGSDSMPELSGNIYVGGAGKQFGLLTMDVYTMQTYGLNIADYLAEHSDGTEQYLFIKDWHIAD